MDTATPPASDTDLPFEQAISRIEELVARMEAERLPLDDLIKAYDEGTRLLDVCRQRLDDAQRRVDVISQRADGSATLTPFAADDAPTTEDGTSRSRQRS
jgi:exodeoxyribonuclease VII small subunit